MKSKLVTITGENEKQTITKIELEDLMQAFLEENPQLELIFPTKSAFTVIRQEYIKGWKSWIREGMENTISKDVNQNTEDTNKKVVTTLDFDLTDPDIIKINGEPINYIAVHECAIWEKKNTDMFRKLRELRKIIFSESEKEVMERNFGIKPENVVKYIMTTIVREAK